VSASEIDCEWKDTGQKSGACVFAPCVYEYIYACDIFLLSMLGR
jgi:hypothetical protein